MSRLETVVSQRNTTTTALGAGETFVGEYDDLGSFQELDINVAGAPSTADGTLYFEFSPDGTHWDVSVPIALAGPSMAPLPLRVVLPRFRIRYVNGSTPQTEFRLTTVLHRTNSKNLTRFLNQTLNYAEPIEVVRAIVNGQKPDDSFVPLPITSDGTVPVSVSAVPLPAGAATEATQLLIEAVLAAIRDTAGIKKIVDAVAITAASLPLPTGASTETTLASRATEATLSAIASTLTSLLTELGQKTEPANQQHVLVDNLPSTQVVSGPLTDTQLRASAVPVSASSLPLPSGAATEATLAGIKTGTDKIPSAPSQEHVTAASPHAARLSDGTAFYKATTPTDTQPISASSLPLPSGASTEATLAAIKAKTDNLDVALSTRTKSSDQQHVLVDNLPGTQPVSGVGQFETTEAYLQQRYDIQSSVIYIGRSVRGTASSTNAWTIKKTVFDGSGNPTQTVWTGSTAVWDNRTSETYS